MEMVLLHNTIEHALLDVLVPLPVVGGEGGGEEGEEGEGGGEEGREGRREIEGGVKRIEHCIMWHCDTFEKDYYKIVYKGTEIWQEGANAPLPHHPGYYPDL